MKATGIVRRIDDLGRVVVPKEIRRTLRLREGTPLEIFTDREGEIILKKYSPMVELGIFAKQYAEAMAQTLGYTVLICDRDQVIAAAGTQKKEMIGQPVSRQLEDMITYRESTKASDKETSWIPIVKDDRGGYTAQLIYPIICEGDAVGAVLIFAREESAVFGETERKAISCAAAFLGKQMEG